MERSTITKSIASIKSNIILLESSTTKTVYENLESLLTLHQIENIFLMPTENQYAEFVKFLAERWQRIRGTALCYTLAPNHPVNKLCIDIAKKISPLPHSPEYINQLADKQGPYFLLMPSLLIGTDVYGENIHLLEFHEFILSDGEQFFIPIQQCLTDASLSDHGDLRHQCKIHGENPLSTGEIQRLRNHSVVVNQAYQALVRFNQCRIHGFDLPAKLTKLAASLRSGGARASGSEYNAGAASNIGIIEFYQYWDGLSSDEKEESFAQYPELRDILGRLFRPKDAEYTQVSFCVELLAGSLDTLIQRLSRDANFEVQQRSLDLALRQLEGFFRSSKIDYNADTKHLITIPGVLPIIYDLPLDIQEQLLKNSCGHTKLLNLILKTNSNMLTEISLYPEDKSMVRQLRFEGELKNPLIVRAARNGEFPFVKYLINDVGVDIDAVDANGNSALSWAAYSGFYEIVEHLFASGANINLQGFHQNTPLLNAALQKRTEVVQLLMARGARLDIRNVRQCNILDFAIESLRRVSNIGEFENFLLDTTLAHMVLLPFNVQEECLKLHGFENVLQFTVIHRPELLPHLFAVLDATGNPMLKMQQLMVPNEFGTYLLHMAVYNDSMKSVRDLLNAGFDINTQNCFSGCTALHEAIMADNYQMTWDLLNSEHYIDISVRDFSDKSVLDYALAKHSNDYVSCISFYIQTLAPMVQTKLIYQMYWYQPVFWNEFIIQKHLDSLLGLFNLTDCTELNQYVKKTFDDVKYQEHLNNLVKMCKKYENSKDEHVADIAKQLLLDLFKAHNNLRFDKKNPWPEKIEEFKRSCLDAIETAKPFLKNNWEWVNVLASFVLMILTLPVSLPLYAMGFFSLQTHSNQTIDNFRQDLLLMV
jgi:ankyrin repeat protein